MIPKKRLLSLRLITNIIDSLPFGGWNASPAIKFGLVYLKVALKPLLLGGIIIKKFVVGDGRRFQLKAGGVVDSIMRVKKVALDGIDLNISVRASDTDMISKLLEMQLPNLGALNGRFSLSGSQDNLAIRNVDLKAKSLTK